MDIYLALPYVGRPLGVEIATLLTDAGHIVTSGWLNETHNLSEAAFGAAPGVGDTEAWDHAQGDLFDIARSDILVMVTGNRVQAETPGIPDKWLHSGGRHVEFGYALAKGKPVHVIGEPENIFQRAFATHHAGVSEFLETLVHTTTQEAPVG